MMIDSTGLCILILVRLTLSLIQGHRDAGKEKNFCANYLPKLLVDSEGIFACFGNLFNL